MGVMGMGEILTNLHTNGATAATTNAAIIQNATHENPAASTCTGRGGSSR